MVKGSITARLRRFGAAAALLAAVAWAGTGCEDGGDSGDGDGNGNADAFIGTWQVYKSGKAEPIYYSFQEDGTYYYADNLGGPAHITGTYTVSDGTLSGPFTNPGVGTGEIVCTITDGVLNMDFIEHWHDPYKHVPCTGTKL